MVATVQDPIRRFVMMIMEDPTITSMEAITIVEEMDTSTMEEMATIIMVIGATIITMEAMDVTTIQHTRRTSVRCSATDARRWGITQLIALRRSLKKESSRTHSRMQLQIM